jgi:copper type II ascorbate-dependent monooxygenase-like protein
MGVLSRWLVGSLVVAIVAAGFLATTHAGPDLRPITLIARSGHVKPGEEKQTCHRLRFPRRQDTEVNRVEVQVKGGSHHVHLYRPYSGTVEYPTKDCPFAVDFSKWELVVASQNPLLEWQLPPGVTINLAARQPLMIQTHFVNAQALDVRGAAKARIKLFPVDPATVTAHGGALFAQDRTVSVAPGRHTQISRCALTGAATDEREMKIMALTGHYHFRGVEFQIYRTHADGTLGELLYIHQGYNDPKFQTFDPPLTLAPGEGLEWWCTWQNDTTETFNFGANTQRNEHCNMFGFYYPTEAPQEAIDCVHRIDDLGNDVNDRIVAQ